MQSTQVTPLVFLVLAIIQVAYGQSIHVVNVGDSGSFYDPQNTAANKGDIITFRFIGTFHSVTQSSFETPCSPLPGGFDSGVAGNPPQTLGPIAEWNLTLQNDAEPIWFFCKLTRPVSHCTAGMVGAINAVTAGTNESFVTFLQDAKALTSQPPAQSGVALTGVGAFATATPIAMNTTNTSASSTSSSVSSTSTTSSTTSSSPTATPTPTPVSASSSSGLSSGAKGGIAGGLVAGVIVVILLVLLFLSYRRGRRIRQEAAANKPLRSQSSRDMSHMDRSEILYGGAALHHHDQDSIPPVPTHVGQYSRSRGSGPSVTESLEQDSTAGPSINYKELAAEIATYMRQNPGTGDQSQTQDAATLTSVPERPAVGTASSAGSTRGPGGRQLPRPPPPTTTSKRMDDTRSIDTLPAYAAGQSR